MLVRIRSAARTYPRQFWLLFWGQMISSTGGSMIWPFLMIYVSGRLKLPLTVIASLMTLNAVMGLIFAFIAGPAADHFGRKWVMVISLAVNGFGYILMGRASTLLEFAVLMALQGAFNPLFRVGADAMMADLVPAEDRPEAYSLMRMSNNTGVALGPAIGGFIATNSYSLAFMFAAAGLVTYSLLLTLLARETLPPRLPHETVKPERFGGYGRILRDVPFVSFTAAFTLTQMCATLIWVLLGVYAKTNFGISERLYGFLPTTNALMVVFLQFAVTRLTKTRPPLRIMALGTFIYACGVGSVALGRGFGGFWISMVVVTLGELIAVPTSTTYVANLAPAEMRGRYMSLYGLTWGVASGIGPVLGGYLNDHLGPQSIWYGGFLIGMVSVVGFLVLARLFPMEKDKELSSAPSP